MDETKRSIFDTMISKANKYFFPRFRFESGENRNDFLIFKILGGYCFHTTQSKQMQY